MRGRVAILVLLLPLVAYAQHDSIYHKPDTTGAQENYRYYVDLTKKPDAIKAVGIPAVEVHISDVNAREEFRKISYVRAACVKTIAGHGTDGYLEAMDWLVNSGQ